MINVFVSIINYNGKKDTLLCLKMLDELNTEGFLLEVVVVDNASKEVFKANTKDFKNFKLHLLRSEENLGFSGGQNLGIKYALNKKADYIVVLNNDVLIDKNLIVELLKTFKIKKDAGLVSPKIYFAKGHEYHKDRYKESDLGKVFWYTGGIMDWKNVIASHRGVDEVDKRQYDELIKTDFVTVCCFMAKKEVFKNAGFFDDDYFLYYEDNDLSQRAKKMGFECYYQPKAVLWHLNAGSAGGSGSKLQDYYITRNRLLFGFRYAPIRARIALLKEGLRLLISGREPQKQGVKDFLMGKFGKGSFSI
ncbi:MAG: glycosyltransferase family 2 protein [Actinobacteria bacterium]|nr:glycosyltransferase family 2 protein [Actinomycetota bacterium]